MDPSDGAASDSVDASPAICGSTAATDSTGDSETAEVTSGSPATDASCVSSAAGKMIALSAGEGST
jgi:hypothetical protein